MVSQEKHCKDCGLAIETGQYCEFCLERHQHESKRGKRKRGKASPSVRGGWRGKPCGGGRGVSVEEREFFGNEYGVAVADDPAARVASDETGAEFLVGNPDAEDVVISEDD